MKPIRVLIVDDSSLVRTVLAKKFTEAGLEVVGTAEDPFQARDLILSQHPDVLTLDLQMPRMDGLTFLDRLMTHFPLPVVILSGLTEANSEMALKALELGAVEVVDKPTGGWDEALSDGSTRGTDLIRRLIGAAQAKPRRRPGKKQDPGLLGKPMPPLNILTDRLVVIGASTGGTEALAEILETLPVEHPGILVVQHMPPFFTKSFAERLDRSCRMRVREARTGDEVKTGQVLLAPGDMNMTLKKNGTYHVECRQTPPVHHVRPSVDVLFKSAAQAAGPRAVGVLLTGMGRDGAEGLLAMREAGAATLAQDEASSVVFGMPKEAIKLGAARQVVPLNQMAQAIHHALQKIPTLKVAAE